MAVNSGDEAQVDLVGGSWDLLFPPTLQDEVEAEPPLKGREPPRSPSDVKRLPARDMWLFGRNPETDLFITVACDVCGMLVVPEALRRHRNARHPDVPLPRTAKARPSLPKKPTSLPSPTQIAPTEPRLETDPCVFCSLCSAAVPALAFRRHATKVHGDDPAAKPLLAALLNLKTAKKPSPPKKPSSKSSSASPPELTDEISKDIKKTFKSKKCKSPIPPELEPMLPAGKRLPLPGGPPDLVPVDAPKKSSKKKMERKIDKVYDPNRNCGVINDVGKPCLRSILCKVHLVAHKRAVLNRGLPYDALTKLLKSQSDDERRPRVELAAPPEPPPPPQILLTVTANEVCVVDEEPLAKRLKTAEIEIALTSDLEAYIEDTLRHTEPLVLIPTVPRPEPLVRWSLDAPASPPTPPPPPLLIADLPWHPAHPRPLATNTFGCRLVGGLLTKCKKLDAFRKHVQSLWASPALTPDSGAKLPAFAAKAGSASLVKKAQVSPRRKRKSSGSTSGGVASNGSSNQPEMMTSLLQRGSPSAVPNGVNGVPLRLFPGNAQPAFASLNLCPSK